MRKMEAEVKILVVYDGSDDSKAALKYGMQKVHATGGELIAFHVHQRHVFHSDDIRPGTSGKTIHDALHGLNTVRTFVNARGNAVTLRIAVAVLLDRQEILNFAGRLDVDLIVASQDFESLMHKACCLTDIVSARNVFAESFGP